MAPTPPPRTRPRLPSLLPVGLLAALLMLTAPPAAWGKPDAAAQHRSPYAGQEQRAIKSLSASDIEALANGRGWGLAKAAELNGVPGPVHLLELKKEIGLSAEQVARIEALFKTMKARAIGLGRQLIDLEKSLNRHFEQGTITRDLLRGLLEKIARVRMSLRLVHLETHLDTPPILTRHQLVSYNRLRGYAQGGQMDHSRHGEEGMQH